MSFLHNRGPSLRARLASIGASTPDLALQNAPQPKPQRQSSIAFPPAVEYVKKKKSPPRPSTSSGIENGGVLQNPTRIMRRVSTFLGHKPSKKKSPSTDSTERPPTPPSKSNSLKRKASNSKKITPLVVDNSHLSRWQVVDEGSDSDDTIDDIRRPSGLGRSVSIHSQKSLPPSPFSTIPEESSFPSARNSYVRHRALSSPHFMGSFTQKAGYGASVRSSMLGTVGHTSMYSTMPSFPTDVWIVVLGFLPTQDVARLATSCKDVYAAAKRVLYRTIDLRLLKPHQIEAVVKLLAYRADLTELVRGFECYTWPDFFPPHSKHKSSRPQSPTFSPMLTATFTIAFQNMHRITSLVLPSFDPTFLKHHSAFGLTKLSFLNTTLSEAEITKLFTWLDGQTNITELEFPSLVDQDDTPSSTPQNKDTQLKPNSPYPSSLSVFKDSTNSHSPASSISLLTPTPTTPLFGSSISLAPNSPFVSQTLLPELSTFVGTPSILTSLVALKSMNRPLKKVTLNINKTLYTGLRPSAVVNTLQELDLNYLGLRFGPSVDRRTVGKVLSACGALFPAGDDDSEDEIYDSKVDTQPRRPPLALKTLEVILTDFSEGADQALYKALGTILPRYRGLQTIRLGLIDCSSQTTTTSERDKALLEAWTKHCPSLQAIRLLSGATWHK